MSALRLAESALGTEGHGLDGGMILVLLACMQVKKTAHAARSALSCGSNRAWMLPGLPALASRIGVCCRSLCPACRLKVAIL